MRQSKAYQHFTRDSLLNLKVLPPNMLCCVVLLGQLFSSRAYASRVVNFKNI